MRFSLLNFYELITYSLLYRTKSAVTKWLDSVNFS